MKKHFSSRLLSLVLVLSLVCALAVPAMAAPEGTQALSFEKVDTSVSVKDFAADEIVETPAYADTDVVRVSIFVDQPATLFAGFSTQNVADNVAAVAYRNALKANQAKVTARIEKALGCELDVVWNLTLAANLISANVEFGQIAEIEKVAGVKEVMIETCYEPEAVKVADEPNMGPSSGMIGSNIAWADGYMGAGSKVAVIDTGIDLDHQSFAESGYNYAMGLNAADAEMTVEEYKASVGVLTAEFVASVAEQLNAYKKADFDVAKTYVSDKIPYAYNYVDSNFTVDHDHDAQGEHGSHVEGIAASNRFIPQEDGTFVPALESVMSQGVAPDAQIVTMKVFGARGGAYDSDYMAAIEDAIVLGCDSANLSLGSSAPGLAFSGSYQTVMDNLANCSTVVTISAGNAGGWNDTPYATDFPYIYADDVSLHTGGSPGTYGNSLCVASVDNDGSSGMPLLLGDMFFFYTESMYTNPPIASTIPGEQPYVVLDGNTGADGDGNNLIMPYAEIVKDKIVMVYRGTSSFYQKMDAAAEAGAAACVIINNQPGVINMDLSSATSHIPCVSITFDDGAAIKEASQAVTDDEGNVLYYTGTITVSSSVMAVEGNSQYYTMSDFSSWGVPGALTMKPEIAAPGGNIYAVNGAIEGGTSYELMSGTSMASPQVAGMAAVVGQYIRENGLLEKTGLTARQLSNSLLMATAVPMFEDWGEYGAGYYPVLRQGAGLANVGAAVNAKSYIWMGDDATAYAADGKVKVELGDDPARTGEYSWSFTVNNFSDTDVSYGIFSSIFTQDVFSYGGQSYMDTWTLDLPVEETITVDGEPYEVLFAIYADVDMDGDTDADDAMAILSYTVGAVADEEIDLVAADVDCDGKISTYDAHLILANRETSLVTVPAGGSVAVNVNVVLPEEVKEYLDTRAANGAYIEGYTYVMPAATEEGEIPDVTYTIPVLGFYGSWTDPSMFDNTTAVEAIYGTSDKIPYLNVSKTNGLYVRYPGANTNYWFVGSPYGLDEEYPADRLAVADTTTLYQFRSNVLRTGYAVAAAINEAGEVVYMTNVANAGSGYYNASSGRWSTGSRNVSFNKTVGSLGVSEGEKLTVALFVIPEYYCNPTNGKLTNDEAKAVIESGVLGKGASISFTATVDNTAPEITGISMDVFTGDLTITAKDDNYVAIVAVTDSTGKTILGEALPEQDEAGQECTAAIALNGQQGDSVLVVVGDYAGNETTYVVYYPVYPSAAAEVEAAPAPAEAAAQVVTVAAEPAAVGTLNSTVRDSVKGAELVKNKAEVEINIVEDIDTTNGLYTVTFDPAVLELVLTNVNADCSVVYAKEGTATIAFACAESIPAGDVVANLQFNRLTKDATNVTIGTSELCWAVNCDVEEIVELDSTVCPTPFTDTPEGNWYHDAVDFVYVSGLMVGTSETTFSPNAVLTRAQLVTILYRMAGEPETEGKSFTDVKEGSWYEAAVKWAAANEITSGTGDGKFNPNGQLNRNQMYTFLARYAKYEGWFVAPETDISCYADAAQVPAWATESISWAVENGLMTATNGNLNPTGTATRAQFATVLMRVFG